MRLGRGSEVRIQWIREGRPDGAGEKSERPTEPEAIQQPETRFPAEPDGFPASPQPEETRRSELSPDPKPRPATRELKPVRPE
jgi:hypothetical protein